MHFQIPERLVQVQEYIEMILMAEVEFRIVNGSAVSIPVQILMKGSKIEDFLKILKNLRIDFELCLESFRRVSRIYQRRI